MHDILMPSTFGENMSTTVICTEKQTAHKNTIKSLFAILNPPFIHKRYIPTMAINAAAHAFKVTFLPKNTFKNGTITI